ncbi:hypothetical protein SMU22_05295 [Streptococcus mutans 4SM1]|nr:hypothetical protein SMU22_05295 [Streptococcus mutans 4SM1]
MTVCTFAAAALAIGVIVINVGLAAGYCYNNNDVFGD